MSNQTYNWEGNVSLTNSEGTLASVGVNENGQHHSGAQLNANVCITLSAPSTSGPIHQNSNASQGTSIQHTHPWWYRSLAEGDVDALRQEIACLQEMVYPVDRSTVLHLAVHFGHGPLISFLLDQVGIKLIQTKNKKGDLAFHVAARAGNLPALQSLVTWVENKEQSFAASSSSSSSSNSIRVGGINKNLIGRENKDKNTALHIALLNGFQDMAWHLVEAWPAASYHLNAQRICPLYMAIESKYWKLVGHMLDKQPISENVARDLLKGKSVVHASIFAKNKEILAQLLNVVLIDAYDEQGRSPLSYAAYLGFVDGVQYIHENYSSHAYKQDKNGCFPIHWAASGGNIKVIKTFFCKFPNTKVLINNKGQNIFHITCDEGKARMVKFLLKYQGLDRLINSKDEDGNSPLHLAMKHPKVVYLLTWDERVKLELQTKDGFTALDIAEDLDKPPTFEERLTWIALRYAGAPRAKGPMGRDNRALTNQDSKTDKGEDQFEERVNTLLLVATLVATVTFSAGFQIPGGYDNFGKAYLAYRFTYQVFTICNALAMYSSIIVVVMLIWAQLNDLKLMLVSLKFAVPVLGVALTMMSVAFMTGVYAALDKPHWLGNVVLVMSFVSIVVFSALFVPLCLPHSIKGKLLRYIFHFPFQLLLFVIG